jgi:tetratricopeptide (TPR) repeat protein
MKSRGLMFQGRSVGSLFLVLFVVSLSALAQTPSDFDDLAAKAAAAREQGDVTSALELYRQAVKLNAKWADGWWFLGSLHYGANEYTAALDAFTHFIQLTPEAGPALALRGLCEFELGDYDSSLNDIQRGISLGAANQPRNEKILRYHEALLLAHKGEFEAALDRYAQLARGNEPNPDLLASIGSAGLRNSALPKDLKPEQRDVSLAVGGAAFRLWSGDRLGAKQDFQKIFERTPVPANAHYFYGYLLFPTDPDEAIVEFKRELEMAPTNALAQTMVAWDALIRNDFPTALAYSQKAVALDPKLPVAQLAFGRALVETGDVKNGIEHLEKELQVEPDNFETHLALAKAYSKSGRAADARHERLYCLQVAQSNPTQGGTPASARP